MSFASWRNTKTCTNAMMLTKNMFSTFLFYPDNFVRRNLYVNFIPNQNIFISAIALWEGKKALHPRLEMIRLFEDFSKHFIHTKLGNSNWPEIGEMLVMVAWRGLVNTLVLWIEKTNTAIRVWIPQLWVT